MPFAICLKYRFVSGCQNNKMKIIKNAGILFFLFIHLGCTDGDKAIEEVLEEVERGAVLRNISFNQSVFDIDDSQSSFDVTIEEMDLEEGGLFKDVDLFIQFYDNTPNNGVDSSPSLFLKTLEKEEFTVGPDGLLRTDLRLSLEEAITGVGLTPAQIGVSDFFELQLILNLTDGRSFNTPTASASILTDDCFFKSPYRYRIPVVDPISDDLYTGTYFYSTIVDGTNGPTFGPSRLVEITSGHSPNVRLAPFGAGTFEFIISGTKIFPKMYESLNGLCRESQINILLGPDDSDYGLADPEDDSVFEIQFIEGYEGWSGAGNPGERPVRIRLSKQ